MKTRSKKQPVLFFLSHNYKDDDDDYKDDASEYSDEEQSYTTESSSLSKEKAKKNTHKKFKEHESRETDSYESRLKKARRNKNKLKEYYTDEDREYYHKLTKTKQYEIDTIEKCINECEFLKTPLRFRVLNMTIDIKLKQVALQKIDEISLMSPSSSEYFKLKDWIETLCKLPIGKYKSLPVSKNDSVENISEFINNTQKRFDELVYGHTESKSQIIQLLAKLISNPSANGIVLGISGAMGTGKTEISMSLCDVLKIPFGFVSLAGANGESVFRGFSYSYEGSRWGRIADILIKSECMNPIIYFDELDKISDTSHGEEVSNFLVHLTDFSQNKMFQDYYFSDIYLDLSKCIFIFSYNDEKLINPILKDRMITIRTNGYTVKDKVNLATDYMLPKIYREYGFEKNDIIIPSETIEYIINNVNSEKGVRNLKRGFEEVIGSLNYKKILGEFNNFPFTINKDTIDKYLLISKIKRDINTNMMYI